MREIRFKALNDLTYYGQIKEWIFDNNNLFYNEYARNHLHYPISKLVNIEKETICQLITKIGDVEIYEYDCWYYEKGNYFVYFYSDDLGLLMQDCVEIKNDALHKNIKESTIQVTDRKVYLSCFELQFIGNWHDGEEYLLNQIKELNK